MKPFKNISFFSSGKISPFFFHHNRMKLGFFTPYVPRRSLYEMLTTVLVEQANCGPILIVAMEYIVRFKQRHNFNVDKVHMHKLIMIAIVVATKYIDDFADIAPMKFISKVLGLSSEEIVELEAKFVFQLNFNLHVSIDKFTKGILKAEAFMEDIENEQPIAWAFAASS